MKYTYRNDLGELARLAGDLEALGEREKIPLPIINALNLCLDELLTNVINYAYEGDGEHAIQLQLVVQPGGVRAVLEDDGKAFNPLTDARAPDLDSSIEDREIGGLGIFFVKEMMDTVSYQRLDGINRMELFKRFESGQ